MFLLSSDYILKFLKYTTEFRAKFYLSLLISIHSMNLELGDIASFFISSTVVTNGNVNTVLQNNCKIKTVYLCGIGIFKKK